MDSIFGLYELLPQPDKLDTLEWEAHQHFPLNAHAIREIQEGRLYRKKHRTFEQYCRLRLGMSRQRAYQLIEGSKVVENIAGRIDKSFRPAAASMGSISPKPPISSELRWEVMERDNFTCHYCGARRFLAIDHIVPESAGGTTTADNLITACKPCNSQKGRRSYQEFVRSKA